jgi:hypothetical protein
MPAPLRKGCAMLRELPLRHGAAIASHPWLVAVLVPAVCILLGAVACLLPTTLGLGFDPAELAAAGSVISRWSRTELALKSGLRFSREPPAAALPPMPPAEAAEPGMPPPSAPPRPPIRHLSLSFLVSNSSAEGNVLRATVLSPLADALALELADSAEPPVVSPLSLGRLLALTAAPLSEEGGLERLLLAPDETMADWASPPLDTLPYAAAARLAALVARVPAAADPLILTRTLTLALTLALALAVALALALAVALNLPRSRPPPTRCPPRSLSSLPRARSTVRRRAASALRCAARQPAQARGERTRGKRAPSGQRPVRTRRRWARAVRGAACS